MNAIVLILQHAAAGEEPQVFNLAAGVSFWTVLIFILLLIVLRKYAYGPILGYAAAREQRIQESLDESQRNREESARLLEEQRQELIRGRQEVQQMLAEGKQAAERTKQDMLAQARTEQEALVERTRADLAREREAMLDSLRREAVDLSLAAAAKLIHQRLDADADRKIVRDYLEHVSATPAVR
jgi:F-type H+-transporting ATPase subunit b